MPPRRSTTKPRRQRRRRQYGGYRRKGLAKYRNSKFQTFTEVLQAGDIAIGAGGVFKTRMVDIPQVTSYATLYKQFCIRKLEVTIMPRLTEFPLDTNASIPAIGSSIWCPRLAYSVDDTPAVQVPATELEVLTDNGARIMMMNKKIKLVCWPKPDIGATDIYNNTTVAVRSKKLTWLNFKNPDVGDDGQDVPHGGIRFYVSGNPLWAGNYAFNVYYRVTFSVRDPA